MRKLLSKALLVVLAVSCGTQQKLGSEIFDEGEPSKKGSAHFYPTFESAEISKLMLQKNRPTMKQIAGIASDKLDEVTGKVELDLATENQIRSLDYVARDILETHPEKYYFLISRDLDYLYDVMQAAAMLHPEGHKLLTRLALVRTSSQVADERFAEQSRAHLASLGLNFEALYAGKERIFISDAYERGTQVKVLLRNILKGINQDNLFSYANTVKNVFKNTRSSLIRNSNSDEGDFDKVRKDIVSSDVKAIVEKSKNWDVSLSSISFSMFNRGFLSDKSFMQGNDHYSWNPTVQSYENNHVVFTEVNDSRYLANTYESYTHKGGYTPYSWRQNTLAQQRKILMYFARLKDKRSYIKLIDRAIKAREKLMAEQNAYLASIKNKVTEEINLDKTSLNSALPYMNVGTDFTLEGKSYRILEIKNETTIKIRALRVSDEKPFILEVQPVKSLETKISVFKKISFLNLIQPISGPNLPRLEVSGKGFILYADAKGDNLLQVLSESRTVKKKIETLKTYFVQLMERGVFVENLNPENLVFDGKQWGIVDIDNGLINLPSRETRNLYRASFRSEMWKSKFNIEQLQRFHAEVYMPLFK